LARSENVLYGTPFRKRSRTRGRRRVVTAAERAWETWAFIFGNYIPNSFFLKEKK
jgi:hypothetical protein